LLAYKKFTNINFVSVAGEREQVAGLTESVIDSGVKLYRIDGLDDHSGFFRIASEIGKIIIDNNITTVHVQNNWQLGIVVFAKFFLIRKFGLKIVYTLHGYRHNEPFKAQIARFLIGGSLMLFAHRVICMSSQLKETFKFLGNKISVLFLGIDPVFFKSFDTKEEKLNVRLQLIFPGQFRTGKNQDILVGALHWLVEETGCRDVRLLLPGAGPEQSRIKSETERLGISDLVIFPGLVGKEQLAEMYASSDVVVIPSNSETFGQSIAEGLVMGKCILSRKVGVALDVIVDGETGLFFNDESDLRRELLYLYNNPLMVEKFKKASIETKCRFEWKNISQEYEKIYLR
jgi:glycosyltransferase involved in cell wall biosynthesis